MAAEKIEIGRKLRKLRKIRQISLTKLAEDTGMSYSYLSGLENEKHSISISNLQRLAEYFEIDLINFLDSNNENEAVFIGKKDRECKFTDDGVSFMDITIMLYNNIEKEKVFLKNYNGKTIEDILDLLEIDHTTKVIVISEGRVLRITDKLKNNMKIKIYPVMDGG